jgi:hypothetical protein
MAVLTWRNVDAPDFRTSMEGFAQFGQLFDKALGGVQRTVGQVDKSISDRVNNEVLTKLLAFSDPEAYQAALSSGQLLQGVDPARLNEGTINSLAGRTTQLLNQKDLTGDIDFETWGRDRTKDQTAKDDVANPFWAQAQLLRSQGKNDEATALLSSPEAQAAIGQQQANKVSELLGKGADLSGAQANEASTRQSTTQSGTRFGWETTDREEGRKTEALFLDLLGQGVEVDDVDAYISANQEALIAKWGAPVVAAARAKARGDSSLSPSVGAGGGGSIGASGGSNNDPTRIMNYEAAGIGFASVPDSVKTLGQASEFAKQVNRAGARSSAMGTFQIVGDTMRRYAPKVFGANWQNVSYDQDAQEKLAEAIFNDNRGSASALSKQWVSLSPSEAEQVRKMPWSEARVIIAGKESGASAAFMRGIDAAVTAGGTVVQNNMSGHPDQDFARSFKEKWQDKTPSRDVARALVGKGGTYEGSDVGAMTSKIQQLRNKYKVSAAVAADILTRADEGDKTRWADKFTDGRGLSKYLTWDGLNSRFNNKEIDRLGKLAAKDGGRALASSALAVEGQVRAMGDADVARANLAAAQQRLNAKVQRAQKLGRKPNIGPELLALQQAQEAYAAAGGNLVGVGIEGVRDGRDPDGNAPIAPTGRRAPARRSPAPRQGPASSAIAGGATKWFEQFGTGRNLLKNR